MFGYLQSSDEGVVFVKEVNKFLYSTACPLVLCNFIATFSFWAWEYVVVYGCGSRAGKPTLIYLDHSEPIKWQCKYQLCELELVL